MTCKFDYTNRSHPASTKFYQSGAGSTELLTLKVSVHFYKQVAPTALYFLTQMVYYKQVASAAFISLMDLRFYVKKIITTKDTKENTKVHKGNHKGQIRC